MSCLAMTRRCCICKQEKALDLFEKDKRKPAGRGYRCGSCCSALVLARHLTPARRERIAAYRATPAYVEMNKVANRQSVRRYTERNSIKRSAQAAVLKAKKRGVISAQPCEVCAAVKAHAHHDDYAKPLDVRWLCYRHHRQWHRENGPGANGDQKEGVPT